SFIAEPEPDSENEIYDLTNEELQEDGGNQTDNEMKVKGFSFRRSRNDLHSDNLNIRCHSFECSQSRAHKAKKGVTKIICTSFVDEHNHEMDPMIIQTAPRFRKLSKEMLEDIEFYTRSTEGLGAKIQYNLLSAKYPNKYIDKKDLHNAIQRIRIPSQQLNIATNRMISKTIYTDADPAMGQLCDVYGQTHIILTLFYRSRNSLYETDFKRHWTRFVEFLKSFPKASRYALETLYPSRYSWAFCYIQTRFTAGIQSTQRVKSMNAIIKKEVLHSLTLLHLVDAIQNRLNEEARYARINEQRNINPSIGLPHIATKFFPIIDSLIQEYLTSHVLSLQRQQLSECFLYNATEISYDWDQFLQEPENIVENGCLEDDYERRQIGLKLLLQTLERDDVVQIWIVAPQGLFPDLIASLPPINFCKSNQPSATNVTPHIIDFRYLSRFRVANVFTPALQKSVSAKTCWSKGHELTKKALNLMLQLNCDDEFCQIMEKFISSKKHELQLL
ncbi:24124_t:CDS:2, partial [Gigaspora rosea]